MFRDRDGKEIDVLTWATRFQDLDYRIVRDDVVAPTPLQVRTVWEGIEDRDGCMFATGVRRQPTSGPSPPFVTFAETPNEKYALHAHHRIVAAIRESSVQDTWFEVVWQLGAPDLWGHRT